MVLRKPFFPLARLTPLVILTGLGITSALLLYYRPEFADVNFNWSALGFVPLALYLGDCYRRVRKRLAVEEPVEREIIIADLRLLAAERCARFWATCFALVSGTAFLLALLVWAYQAAIWYRAGSWVAITWNTAIGLVPSTSNAILHKVIYFLGDTNLGVAVIIIGLLIAAPLATLNHRANLNVRRRKKELGASKKTPISSYET